MDSRLEKAHKVCTADTYARSVKRKVSDLNPPNKKARLQSQTPKTAKKNKAAPKRTKRPWSAVHERKRECNENRKARKCRSLPSRRGPRSLNLEKPVSLKEEKSSNGTQCKKEVPQTPRESKATPSDLSMFEIGELLGEGGFGAVYEAIRKSDQRVVALKFIKSIGIHRYMEVDGERVPEEVFYHSKLHHPSIIELLDYFWANSSTFVMVMEKPDEPCDLTDYMIDNGVLEEDEGKQIFKQVLDATIHCEERRIFHRDIKSENIILDMADDEFVKLTDFGLSSTLQREPYNEFRGTRDFCPPEFFASGQYRATPATVWQLGCLLVDMLSWFVPYENPMDALTKPPYIPSKISNEARDLIKRMLTRDQHARPSLQEIKQHPWLR